MIFRLVLNSDKTVKVSQKTFTSMDDALDALQVMEDFDKAEGFYTENRYAITAEKEVDASEH